MGLKSVNHRLHAKSTAVLLSLENRFERILQLWLLLGGLACAARLALSPAPRAPTGFSAVTEVAPYLLIVVAPFVSALLALRWFADGDLQPQPATRLALVGSWHKVHASQARAHPLYGTTGIMVSLLIGILLNVPVRALEYFAAMPPIPTVVPQWLSTLHFAMTFDAVVFTSLYAVAFVAALRRVPLFPRLLVAIWLGDLTMQLATAQMVAATPGLPSGVGDALRALIEGNVKKVLISMGVWLPYLLLSRRVNVTYRHRVPDSG